MFYLKEFENHLRANDMSNTSVVSYMSVVNDFTSNIGVQSAKDINIQVLDGYKRYMTNKGLAKSTKAKCVSYVKTYLRFLYKYGYAEYDISDDIKAPKVDHNKAPVFLSKEKFTEAFCDVNDYHTIRNKALLLVFLSAGVRESEFCALNRSDIDGNKVTVWHGKGDKSRVVYLNQQTLEYLNKYLEGRNDNNEALFISQKDNRISWQQVTKIIEKYCHVSPHKLRHTCASLMAQNGVDLEVIRDYLGHSNIQTTNIYIHAISTSGQSAANCLEINI